MSCSPHDRPSHASLFLRASLSLVAVLCVGPALAAETQSLRPSQVMPASPGLIQLGKTVYQKQCLPCHGPGGRGDGPAAYLLNPKPRNFVAAQYRLVSTWERVPTDEDLFYTISRGMPGSAMPSWAHLPEKTRWGLVHYVKSLAEKPLVVAPTTDPKAEGEHGTGVIHVPPEPPYAAEAQQQAASFFTDACASCHGSSGRGDGAQEQVNAEGFATRPRNLTLGIYKGSFEPEAIYRRIIAGMPGTPMPMNDWAYGDDGWQLVHYVLSLSDAEKREQAAVTSANLVARKVSTLPVAVEDAAWGDVAATRIRLLPLWWRDERVDDVMVQTVHDGKRLAVRLSWQDAARNDVVTRPQDFTDGAAVQFSAAADPPLFAMGSADSPVNIWHWKAVWEHDRAAGVAKLEDAYPAMPGDLHPGKPNDDVYMTATSVGNPVAPVQRTSSVEDTNAGGFGTLTDQGKAGQNVDGKAVWADGRWDVMFVRDLRSGQAGDIPLTPGRHISIAFAVWDGAAGDRNGQKSVSIWQRLAIEP